MEEKLNNVNNEMIINKIKNDYENQINELKRELINNNNKKNNNNISQISTPTTSSPPFPTIQSTNNNNLTRIVEKEIPPLLELPEYNNNIFPKDEDEDEEENEEENEENKEKEKQKQQQEEMILESLKKLDDDLSNSKKYPLSLPPPMNESLEEIQNKIINIPNNNNNQIISQNVKYPLSILSGNSSPPFTPKYDNLIETVNENIASNSNLGIIDDDNNENNNEIEKGLNYINKDGNNNYLLYKQNNNNKHLELEKQHQSIIHNEIENILNKYSDIDDTHNTDNTDNTENTYNTSIESLPIKQFKESSSLHQINYEIVTLKKKSPLNSTETSSVQVNLNKTQKLLTKENPTVIDIPSPPFINNNNDDNDDEENILNKSKIIHTKTIPIQKRINNDNISTQKENKKNNKSKKYIHRKSSSLSSSFTSTTSSSSSSSISKSKSSIKDKTKKKKRNNNNKFSGLKELFSSPPSKNNTPTFPSKLSEKYINLVFPSPSSKKQKVEKNNESSSSSSSLGISEINRNNNNSTYISNWSTDDTLLKNIYTSKTPFKDGINKKIIQSNEDEFIKHKRLFETIGEIKEKKLEQLRNQIF